MRVDLLTPIVDLRAAQRGVFTLQVRNDSDVIEQIVCTVPGLDAAWYEVSPVALNLFPGDVGEIRLTLMLPRTFPAGRHELSAQITGRVRGQTLLQRLVVDVHPLFDTLLVTHPAAITARHRGRYLVTLQNRGNAPSEMSVRASDSEAALELELDRPVMTVHPGEEQTTALFASGKRPWFGTPIVHQVQVTAEQLPEVLEARVTLRLKPRLTAGLLTALMLATIVAVWATALLLSTNAAFGTGKPSKVVPANFTTGVDVQSLNPATVGSALSGTITAQSNGAPLARITVEMYGANQNFITAVASGSNGGYSFVGVLPGRYRLRFRAPGFEDRWFPDATSATAAQVLEVKPKTPQEGLNQAMPGGPGSLTTTVVAADGSAASVSVEVVAIDIAGAAPVTQTGVAGQPLTFAGLATPATYRITAKDPSQNFLDAEITQQLGAGQAVTTNPIGLTASAGTISGTVVDGTGQALGDVKVLTSVNGKAAATVTPTSGSVGAFSFTGLATPATYVLEFSGTGVASTVVAVRLDAGSSSTGMTVTMTSATGTISGLVTADGAGLGGATVTVTGGGFTSTATTFTANPPGSYTVTGVPAPGTYVVTVSAPGRVSSSSSVTIAPGQTGATADADLLPALGQIFGTVTLDGKPIGAATVTVSNGGANPASTVTATVGTVGSYSINGLAPGIYTVTATFAAGTANQAGPLTKLVVVDVNPALPGQAVVLALTSP